MTDSELLCLFASERSNEAFSELVSRRLNLVYSIALRYVGGDAHCAKDVSQLVFIDLARKAEALCRHEALLGWFYTSTHYAASKIKRSETRHQRRLLAVSILDFSEPSASPDSECLRRVLDQVIVDLSPRERELVLARFFESSRLAVIGERLGISENAAQKALERALERMRKLFARRGITTTSAVLSAALCGQSATAAPPTLLQGITNQIQVSACASQVSLWGVFRSARAVKLALSLGLISTASILVTAAVLPDKSALKRIQGQTGAAQLKDRSLDGADTTSNGNSARPLRTSSNLGSGPPAVTAPTSDLILAPNLALTTGNPNSASGQDGRLQSRVDTRYRALFERLEEVPERVAALRKLLVEEEMALRDLHQIASARGIFPGKDPAGFHRLTAETTETLENEIKLAIGEDQYAVLKNYQQTMPERITTAQLEQSLAPTASPLTGEQTEQLVEILAQNAPTPVAERGPPVGMFFEAAGDGTTLGTDELAGSRISDAALAHAAGILSGPQLKALRDSQQRQRLQVQEDRDVNRPAFSP